MRRLLALAALAAALAFGCAPARAQNAICPDVANGDSSQRCANTKFVGVAAAAAASAAVTPLFIICPAHQWVNAIGASASVCAQPAFGDLTGTIAAGQIANATLTNAMFANMANNTVKGNVSGGPAAPSDLTATQLTTLCNAFTSVLPGCVPASGGGTTNFLRADGTFAPTGGSGTFIPINIKSVGAKCDVVTTGSGNAVTTAGGFGLQTSTGAFTAGDIGKRIRIAPAAVVTITIASPGVVTWNSHGLSANAPVQLTTTGALPTGLVSTNSILGPQIYYVVGASITANTFQLSLAPGGAAINTSGSQSGTQTAFSYTTTDTSINSVSSATSIGLANTVPSTGTVGQFWYGTDDSAAIQSAVNTAVAANSAQSDVYIPGTQPCLIASTITVAGAMKMHGDGKTVSNLFLGTGSMDGITVTAGSSTVSSSPTGITGASNAFNAQDFGIFSFGVPTGGSGIKFDTGNNNLANFHSRISNMRFNSLFVGVNLVRASYYTIDTSNFENNIAQDVLQQSLHNVDYDSGHIGPNNQFLSFLTPQATKAAVEIQGGSSTTVALNRFLGGNIGVYLNWLTGTGGELFVSDNHMEVLGQATASGASPVSSIVCIKLAVPGGSGFGRVKITGNELSCLAPAGGTVWDILTQGTGTISEFLVDDNLFNFGGTDTAIGLQFDFVSHAKAGSGNIFTNLGGPTATGIIGGANSTNVEFGHPAMFGTMTKFVNNVPVGQYNFIPVDPAPITNSLSGDVAMNNTANYFPGPSVAQGSTGTWCASGTVTALDTVGAATFFAKLWDGTTVIASAAAVSAATNFSIPFSLSGCLASPAGNLRIDVKDISSTNGVLKFNQTLNSKDSTITAWRIK